MVISWWWLGIAFMFLFIVPPVGYGWGYRGWGPPYPRYIQRRRGQQAVAVGSPAAFNHHSWGWGGDFVWMMLLIAMFVAFTGFWRGWR
jgi:hypothetical protein